MSMLLIRNCNVLKLAHPYAIGAQQDIIINGNRIENIQLSGQVDDSHFDHVIDATGLLAAPGLINTHSHVPMIIFRGLAPDVNLDPWFNDYMWPLERNLQPDDVYWGMKLGIIEMIRAGVTTFADHYFHLHLGGKAVEETGMRALLGWAIFGTDGEPGIRTAVDFARDWNGAAHGRIATILAPHSPYTCDDDYLRAVAREAQRLGMGIHIHAAETVSQTQTSLAQHGLTPIQVLHATGILDHPTLIAHGCGLTEGDIALLADKTAGIAHAAKTYLKLAMGLTPIPELRSAGVPVGLATDGPVSNDTLDLWEVMRLTALAQKHHTGNAEVLNIDDMLTIAFAESAKVIESVSNLRGLGALEAGYLADIILIDLNTVHHQPLYNVGSSLVYNMQPADVRTVIIDGQVVMRDRELLTVDESEVISVVREQMKRLSRRDPAQRIQVYRS